MLDHNNGLMVKYLRVLLVLCLYGRMPWSQETEVYMGKMS